jgi:flavin-dependent dehydrogenase
MKIAIIGAGTTGAYLYRLLVNRGHQVDIFNRDPGTRCGISPCAWGTSKGFAELVAATGLDPSKYLFRSFDYVVMDEIRIRADLTTFHKPALIRDLLQGAEVIRKPLAADGYDRIIDATGVSRAFLPALAEDILLPCRQWRVRTGETLPNRIKLGKIGYAWCFPLADHEYHIGCGSLASDPRSLMANLGWIANASPSAAKEIICTSSGRIRLTAPVFARPFVRFEGAAEVWGVGEAIGCVAPLAGDGIVPGMKSVQILLDCWKDPAAYQQTILQEFRWMEKERRVIDKLRAKRNLDLKDAWVLKRNSQRMGMRVPLKDAIHLLSNLR